MTNNKDVMALRGVPPNVQKLFKLAAGMKGVNIGTLAAETLEKRAREIIWDVFDGNEELVDRYLKENASIEEQGPIDGKMK